LQLSNTLAFTRDLQLFNKCNRGVDTGYEFNYNLHTMTKLKQQVTPNLNINPLADALMVKHGLNRKSWTTAVGQVDEMKLGDKRRLFVDLVGPAIDIPKNNYFLGLLTMYLIQDMIRLDLSLPINDENYKESYKKAEKLLGESYIAQANNNLDPEEASHTGGFQTSKEGNKQDKAIDLFRDNPDMEKDELVALMVEELELVEATAINYYYAAKRKLNPEQPEYRRDEKTGELKKVRKGGRKSNPNSKLNQAVALYEDEMSREDFVNLVMEKIGLNKNTATCYFYQAKNKSIGTTTEGV